jgi:bloom syndrome protein
LQKFESQTFTVKYFSKSLQIKDVDHYHAALRASHLLLVSGKLVKYSVGHATITVCGLFLTKVYKAWKILNVNGIEVPDIECERTFVNEKWFDAYKNKNSTVETTGTDCNANQCISMMENMSISTGSSSQIEVPTIVSCAADLKGIMSQIWGFSSFKGKQEAAVDAILQLKNCFINMPTGGGKSLVYQLPAVSQTGVTVIVEPITALIADQIDHCRSKNISAAALYGELQEDVKQHILHDLNLDVPPFKLLYTTPEFLVADTSFHTVMKKLNLNGNIQRFVIDECHCVSLWGREFRPSYLRLNFLRKLFPSVQIVMLTATSTYYVQQDVCSVLSVVEPVVLRDSYNKLNLQYVIENKDGKLDERIAGEIKDSSCSLVYGSTRLECEAMCAKLVKRGVKARAYHGDMSKLLKKDTFEKWMSGKIQCLVCTKAFGMGVDKPNVEVIIHISMPSCMEDYYQETGRGGRNGQPCKCILYYSPTDSVRHFQSVLGQHTDVTDTLNKRYRHFFKFLYFCFQIGICRRMLILKYFDSGDERCSDLKCDQCIKNLNITEEDITQLA